MLELCQRRASLRRFPRFCWWSPSSPAPRRSLSAWALCCTFSAPWLRQATVCCRIVQWSSPSDDARATLRMTHMPIGEATERETARGAAHHRAPAWLLVLPLLAVVLAAVLYFGASAYITDQATHAVRNPVQGSPADLGLQYEPVSLRATSTTSRSRVGICRLAASEPSSWSTVSTRTAGTPGSV